MILFWTAVAGVAVAAHAGRQVVSGHVPEAIQQAKAIGRLPAANRLQLSIGLPLRNQSDLSQLLQDLYNPESPRYRQYLTPDEFARAFGPTEADYQALVAFARSSGLEIVSLHPNRMVLDVCAPVEVIEKVFDLTLEVFQHPRESRTFFAPIGEPSLDLTVPVLNISGLDNLVVPRPAGLKLNPGAIGSPTPLIGSGPGGSYRGSDFRGAYVRGITLNGAGQYVGLVQFDGYYPSDIAAYAAQASLPAVPLYNVLLNGFSGNAGPNNIEVAMDIELAMSMAPGLSGIIVYEGTQPNSIMSRIATDNLAKQISASWTYPVNATTSQIFQQFAAQGQAFFNASGDSGAYPGAISTPVDDLYVIAVGGTTLSTSSPGGPWTSETTWNWGNSTGSTGGGISTRYAIPSWQQGINMAANQGSTTMRNVPDVALTADDCYVIYDNGSSGSVGGTSAASPLWAAFLALVNQQAVSVGSPPIGFINPVVYAIGKGAGFSTNFHDITTGNNTWSNSPSRFFAVTGYDLCTGWGTPNGTNLVNTLAPRPNIRLVTNASATITSEGCLPANGAIDPGETVTVNIGLKNLGSVRTTNLVGTLLAEGGVTFPSNPQAYGSLLGGGITVTRNFSFTAAGICGSNLTLRLQLQDGTANLGTQAFSFTLGKPLAVVTQNMDSATAPVLPAGWTSTTSGSGMAWITSSASRDSVPNSAFASEPANPGTSELVSPVFVISTTAAQVTFRHYYDLEADDVLTNRGYDGGVLEIAIGTNAFTDILTAGGAFITNGYTRVLDPTNDNPLASRPAWSGSCPVTYITTIASLPASAAGESLRLRWRLAVDTGNAYGGTGWRVDNILIQDGYACCNAVSDLGVSQTASPDPATIGQDLTYNILVTNAGPQQSFGVKLTDTLATNVSFVSSSSGTYSNGVVTVSLGTMPAAWVSAVSITVTPLSAEPITNLLAVTALTPDGNPADNVLTTVTTVIGGAAPAITTQPTNVVAAPGANAVFQVSASGTPAPVYQWYFNSNVLSGATSNLLTLTNVQAADAGGYFVIATNPAGSATSVVAHLTVLVPPQIPPGAATATSSNFSLAFGSVAGLSYLLEYKDSLDVTNWTPLPPAVPGTGGVIVLTDTNAPVLPSRYYRVLCQP